MYKEWVIQVKAETSCKRLVEEGPSERSRTRGARWRQVETGLYRLLVRQPARNSQLNIYTSYTSYLFFLLS